MWDETVNMVLEKTGVRNRYTMKKRTEGVIKLPNIVITKNEWKQIWCFSLYNILHGNFCEMKRGYILGTSHFSLDCSLCVIKDYTHLVT